MTTLNPLMTILTLNVLKHVAALMKRWIDQWYFLMAVVMVTGEEMQRREWVYIGVLIIHSMLLIFNLIILN